MTKDGRRLIVMAISPRQWKGLVEVLDIHAEIAGIEAEKGVTFDYDEGVRYEHSDKLYPLVAEKISHWTFDKLSVALDKVGGCWGEYQTVQDAAKSPVLVGNNPIFEMMKNPSGATYPTSGAAATISGETRGKPRVAPVLGDNTHEVLSKYLNIDQDELSSLSKSGIIGPKH